MKYLIILAVIGAVAAQGFNDGQYRPDNSGRYSGNDGKYVATKEVRRVVKPTPSIVRFAPPTKASAVVIKTVASGDDGQYRPDNTGRYVAQAAPAPIIVQEVVATEAPRPVFVVVKESPSTQAPITAAPATQAPTTAAPTTLAPSTAAPAPQPQQVLVQYVKPKPVLVPAPVQQVVQQRFADVDYNRKYDYTNSEGQWKVLSDVKQLNENGYNFAYQTENKIAAQETAQVVDLGKEGSTLRLTGFFEYVGDDGNLYRVDYIADENGFQPFGAHFPKAPVAEV